MNKFKNKILPRYTIIYNSVALPDFTLTLVDDMLFAAKKFNAQNTITGIILFANGQFLQLIEGEESKIKSLYKRISNDTRHHKVNLLFNQKTERRLFKDWYMSYYDLSGNATGNINKRLILESYLDQDVKEENLSICLRTLRMEIQKLLK